MIRHIHLASSQLRSMSDFAKRPGNGSAGATCSIPCLHITASLRIKVMMRNLCIHTKENIRKCGQHTHMHTQTQETTHKQTKQISENIAIMHNLCALGLY